jgi:hypothetical protein
VKVSLKNISGGTAVAHATEKSRKRKSPPGR